MNTHEAPNTFSELQQERRDATQFAKDYVTELAAGNVPGPKYGDCSGCTMVAKDGSHPMGGRDHMLGHISKDERYYVPSIAVNAAKRFDVSRGAQQWLSNKFLSNETGPDLFHSPMAWVFSEQIRKAIRRWVLSELGHQI